MGFEIWNRNAKEGKIEMEKINADITKERYKRDVELQTTKSNVWINVANIVGEIAKMFIGQNNKKSDS